MLAVLALSHVPAAAAWTGTSADTISGSKIVVMPAAKRLAPASDLGRPLDAVLPPALLLVLAAGVVAGVLAVPTCRARFGPRPRAARGPPLPLR